jgi:hypothetical protein
MVMEMLQHLKGFMTCLNHLGPMESLDTEEALLLKCSWYNGYVMAMRFLRREDSRGCGHILVSEVSDVFAQIDRLADSWWELHVDDGKAPFWLQQKYSLVRLKFAVYELQRALDYYHLLNGDGHALRSNDCMTAILNRISNNLNQVRVILQGMSQDSYTKSRKVRSLFRMMTLHWSMRISHINHSYWSMSLS